MVYMAKSKDELKTILKSSNIEVIEAH